MGQFAMLKIYILSDFESTKLYPLYIMSLITVQCSIRDRVGDVVQI